MFSERNGPLLTITMATSFSGSVNLSLALITEACSMFKKIILKYLKPDCTYLGRYLEGQGWVILQDLD